MILFFLHTCSILFQYCGGRFLHDASLSGISVNLIFLWKMVLTSNFNTDILQLVKLDLFFKKWSDILTKNFWGRVNVFINSSKGLKKLNAFTAGLFCSRYVATFFFWKNVFKSYYKICKSCQSIIVVVKNPIISSKKCFAMRRVLNLNNFNLMNPLLYNFCI